MRHHPSEEAYHVIGALMQFRTEASDWATYGAGRTIHNAPWTKHALRSLDEPMFLLYGWSGEVMRPAELTA